MSHIVICWEMGGGMGHLVPLSLLGAEMVAEGDKVTFIANDLAHATRFLAPHGIEWLQVPKLRPAFRPKIFINHADILRTSGYDTSDRLLTLLLTWRTMLQLLRPDKLVCEYAPTAQLAARSMGVPCVCIDNGFSMPPVSDPMPPLRDELIADVNALRASEEQTLQVINEAMCHVGAVPLPRFSCLYEDEVWYRNWPEFNHFGPHSVERHLGQIFGDADGAEPIWPTGEGSKLFAYVKADNPFGESILRAAVSYGFRVLAYLPGFRAGVVDDLVATGRVVVSKVPIKLSALEDDVEIGIWQSPTGGVGHSLEKGMRMLFLPSQLEQYRACCAVERSGVPAYVVNKPENWREVFERLLAMPRMHLTDRWKPADISHMAQLLARR